LTKNDGRKIARQIKLHFHTVQICLAISRLAISCHANWSVNFTYCIFMQCHMVCQFICAAISRPAVLGPNFRNFFGKCLWKNLRRSSKKDF